ncbi:MAG: hypothetical protein AMQ22_00682 [Candidatus Methanofastidiosum methylothiophilum]|uniref:Uncharacterized protein n=1 Tax=Candidatus Methanofastidiosum methylothiophilum TaxID=1705564 RepID=A0A150J5X5_9EURY|nr:MAG: hypothetical protein AMQ22_00682 [Candidatus Methanofastidiosum methylthiophilus]
MRKETQTQYITKKLIYKQLRKKLIYAKQAIDQNYRETKQFYGEHDAKRIKNELIMLFDLTRLRQAAINARYMQF